MRAAQFADSGLTASELEGFHRQMHHQFDIVILVRKI
jgi:hypothetical protein